MAEQQGNPPGPLPPLPPGLVPIQLPEIDYAHLSTLVADQVIERFDGRFDRLRETEKKRKERCGHLQCVITKLMLSGLHVAKVDQIGSEDQPGPLDLDEDDEPPWEIDFSKSPDHAVNKEVVKQWVHDVLNSDDLEMLVAKGKLKPEECTEAFVRSLLINSFDAARKAIKINQDETGERLKRVKDSKEKSKKKQRRKALCSNRWNSSRGRLWNDKEIPKAFFKPEYHSDSEADPAPNLSTLERPMTSARYAELRNGAAYEMITPGWRSQEMTRLFRWLDEQHKADTNNRPSGTRWYCSINRKWDADDIPDNAPRCMISDDAWNNSMNQAKKDAVLASPAGW
ncbi:hypothetical protein FRC06_004890 [Ceratobasidium sp. 370]|nr:hypothetical protein FRC06_004890 [Ceratobasidium sp. 370]